MKILYLPGILSCLLFVALLSFLPQQAYAQTGCRPCVYNPNLVTDGDFSAGTNTLAVGVNTSLNPLCACNYPNNAPGYGSYCVDLLASNKCQNFLNVADHSNPGVSGFMIIDGYGRNPGPGNLDIWGELITIATPGSYDFSFWFHPNVSGLNNFPILAVRINGTIVTTNIGATPTMGRWNEFCSSYNLTAGTHNIEILQVGNFSSGGLDYGIDDVFLSSCVSCNIIPNFNITASLGGVQATNTSTDPTDIDSWYWELFPPNGPPVIITGSDPNGTNSILNPDWDFNYPNAQAGTYTLCLTVKDSSFPDCVDQYCIDFEIIEADPDCDVSAAFNTSQPGPVNQYFFDNQSTASSFMHFNWTVVHLSGVNQPYVVNQSSPPGPVDLLYTFPIVGTYEVCLEAAQLESSFGLECVDKVCQVITINSAPDFVEFELSYSCGNPSELFITNINTNANPVDITTTCTGSATPQPPSTVSPNTTPILVATQPNHSYSTCQVTVSIPNTNVSYTLWNYFNCQFFNATINPDFNIENPARLLVFPNPSQGEDLQLEINNLSGPILIELIDATGKVLTQLRTNEVEQIVRKSISTTGISPGLYFVRVRNGQTSEVQKVIIE